MNPGSPKLILFPPLGQEDAYVMLEMSIACKPSGPEQGGEVAVGGRADRCVRKGKQTLFPHLTQLGQQRKGAQLRRSHGSGARPGKELEELALIATMKSDSCVSGNRKRCG